MAFKFRPNPKFAEELKHDPEFRRFAMSKAQDAADKGAQHVPPGFMVRGRKPTAEQASDGATLVLEGPGWHLIEFGTAGSPPHAPLRKGIEAAGMTYKPR